MGGCLRYYIYEMEEKRRLTHCVGGYILCDILCLNKIYLLRYMRIHELGGGRCCAIPARHQSSWGVLLSGNTANPGQYQEVKTTACSA